MILSWTGVHYPFFPSDSIDRVAFIHWSSFHHWRNSVHDWVSEKMSAITPSILLIDVLTQCHMWDTSDMKPLHKLLPAFMVFHMLLPALCCPFPTTPSILTLFQNNILIPPSGEVCTAPLHSLYTISMLIFLCKPYLFPYHARVYWRIIIYLWVFMSLWNDRIVKYDNMWLSLYQWLFYRYVHECISQGCIPAMLSRLMFIYKLSSVVIF